MQTKKISEDIRKALSLIERYEALANKGSTGKPELDESAKMEMRLIRQGIISTIIDTKKNLLKLEHRIKF